MYADYFISVCPKNWKTDTWLRKNLKSRNTKLNFKGTKQTDIFH